MITYSIFLFNTITYPQILIYHESQDSHGDLNNHGRSLIELCKSQDIHMLNGRTIGDLNGELTCFTHSGCSLVDYTIASSTLFSLFTKFEILLCDEYTHLPQSFVIKCNEVDVFTPPCINEFSCSSPRNVFKWTDQSVDKLTSDHMNALITDFHNKIENGNVNEATRILTESLQYVCSKTKRRNKENGCRGKKNPWWDEELEELRKHKHRRLRILHLESSDLAITQYRNIRNQFKKVFRQKKILYKLQIRTKIEACKSATEFWSEIHYLKQPKLCVNNISVNMWCDYFSQLLNMPIILDEVHSEEVIDYIKEFLLSIKEEINVTDEMIQNINILNWKYENGVKCEDKGPILYAKLTTKNTNQNQRITTTFIDEKTTNEIDPFEIMNKRGTVTSAIRIENIIIGNRIKVQVKLVEVFYKKIEVNTYEKKDYTKKSLLKPDVQIKKSFQNQNRFASLETDD